MERLFSILTATATLMILIAGAGVYFSSKTALNQAREDAVVSKAQMIAQTISKQVQFMGGALDKMALDPEVASAILSGDRTSLSLTASKLEKYLPGVKKIRLVPVGTVEQDQANVPHMSFGDIDMVKATFLDNPLPAIQGDPGPNRHLAITRRVMEGNQAVGVILASLDFDFIAQSLNEANVAENYFEIRQDKLALASTEKKDEEADLNKIQVLGTNWEIYFADPNSVNLGYSALIFSFILLPLLLALGAFYVIHRQLSVLLAQDQDWVLKAFKDILTDKPKGSYPVVLNGMDAVIASMVRFNRDVEKNEADTAARERDDFELEGYFDELHDSISDIEQQIQDVVTESEVIKPAKGVAPVKQEVMPAIIPEPEKTVKTEASKVKKETDTIFRAYDIRGIVGKTLTEEIVRDIGKALGSEAKGHGCHTLVIGRDGRLSSPNMAKALSKGIISTGCDVLDIGVVPTPVLYFVVQHTDGRSGVMITGSHNPAEYNGLKMMMKGDTLSGERIQKLKQRIDEQDFVTGNMPGSIDENVMFVNEYIGTVCDDIQVNRELKVVVDCGNGVAGEIAPALLKELGCEVVEMYCEIDGNFPNHHPDPSKPENLAELRACVVANNADIGIAFDGDADRLGVVDSSGNIIWPDRQMMLFAKDVLAGKPGSEIIYDVKCSRHLADQIVKYGGRPLMWKTGHSFMKAKLKETGAKLAGEMSGHIFFNDRWFGFDDALYSAARLLQILAEDHRSSAQIFADFPDSLNTPELNVELAEGENTKFIEGMFANADFSGGKVTNIDGMRIDFSDGWGLVRASNTTPSLVIRFEANNQQALAKIQEQFRELMLKVKPDIKLPF